MALNLLIVGYLQPIAHYRYEGLRFDLRSGALGASIKVGEFNRFGKRITLRIDRSEDQGTRLEGIFVQVDDPKGGSVAATAERGRFLATDDPADDPLPARQRPPDPAVAQAFRRRAR